MDYLFGLRLIIAFSIVGLALMIGAKVCSLGGKSKSSSQPKETNPLKEGGQRLKDDFWSAITGN